MKPLLELGFSPHKVVDTQRSREVPQALVLTAGVLIYSHLSISRINSSRDSQRVLELEGSPVLWTGTASSSLSPGPGIK